MSACVKQAFDRLDKAQDRVLQLAVRIGGGATAEDLAIFNPDHVIRGALREMHEARYDADVALCSFMRNEPYQPRPTQSAQGVEMQARLLRNERQPRSIPTGTPHVVSVGSL